MRWLISILTWLSADADAVEAHVPRAAACSQAAYASLVRDRPADEGEPPAEDAIIVPGGDCKDGACSL